HRICGGIHAVLGRRPPRYAHPSREFARHKKGRQSRSTSVGNQKFESISLQRGVSCEPKLPRSDRQSGLTGGVRWSARDRLKTGGTLTHGLKGTVDWRVTGRLA